MCGDGCAEPRWMKRLHDLYVVLDNFGDDVLDSSLRLGGPQR